MKPERAYLDELNTSSKAYKVKVKVIEKGRPKISPKKGVTYQSLLLEDDKGNRMRGALFGDQVEGYKDAFVYNGVYEIANAPIKSCDPQWKTNQSDLDYQMSFGSNTIIQPVDSTSGPIQPDYQAIAQIPKVGSGEEKFDVLGIIIYVERSPRRVITAQQREIWVREIIITDNSAEQPVTVSAWNDLAGDDCDRLIPLPEKFGIVGFTALKVSSYKGFSLTTSMSTTFVQNPVGDRASSLRKWVVHHHNDLAKMQGRVLEVRTPDIGKEVKTIEALQQKKAQNTLQEERHWLRVTVPEPDFDKINAYLGCSNCGKRTEIAAGLSYSCTTCSKTDCVSSPRITFHCEVADETGKLAITAFTTDSEKLFGQSAPDLFRLKHTDNQELFQNMVKRLQNSPFLIQVGPKVTLSRNNVLQWILKKVEVDDKPENSNVGIETSATSTPTKTTTHDKAKTSVDGRQPPAEAPINEVANIVILEGTIKQSPKSFHPTPEAAASHVELQMRTADDRGETGDSPKQN